MTLDRLDAIERERVLAAAIENGEVTPIVRSR